MADEKEIGDQLYSKMSVEELFSKIGDFSNNISIKRKALLEEIAEAYEREEAAINQDLKKLKQMQSIYELKIAERHIDLYGLPDNYTESIKEKGKKA